MDACLKHKNLTCRFRNPVVLALVLLLVATLALLSAFELEGSAPGLHAGFFGSQAGDDLENRGALAQDGQACQGCYYIVRQPVEAEAEEGPAESNP